MPLMTRRNPDNPQINNSNDDIDDISNLLNHGHEDTDRVIQQIRHSDNPPIELLNEIDFPLPDASQPIPVEYLQRIGFLGLQEKYITSKVVTDRIFSKTKDYNGWRRGGAESFYQVWEIVIESESGEKKTKHLAFKAVISEGTNITDKTVKEAILQAILYTAGVAPRVYGISGSKGIGVIVREFVTPDLVEPSSEDKEKQWQKLEQIFKELGFSSTFGLRKTQVMFVDGEIKVIDCGTGDMSNTTESVEDLFKILINKTSP